MASVGNSYGLLNGGHSENVGSKKKRRPRKAVAEPPEPVVDSCASSASGMAREYAADEADLDGFVPAGRPQRSRSSSISTAGLAGAGPSPQSSSVASEPIAAVGHRITVERAAELVEQAALGMVGTERLRLWRDWLQQLDEMSAGRGVQYVGPNNSLVDFRQMLLQSRALEISVEGCIWKPAPPGGDGLLADVLRAFLDPALAPSVPSLMAAKITDLSGLIAHESEATRSAATAALAAVVSALKAPHERLAAVGANSPHRGSKPQAPDDAAASLAAVDRELEQQQMALEHANTVRDRAQAAKRMLALADRRLELITGSDRGGASPSCSPTANAVQAAIRDLNLWTGLVGASSKATPKNGQQAAGRRQADDPARQAQREDGRLAAAQADVAADIHRLEEKLRELHRQAALLAEQRRALASTPQNGRVAKGTMPHAAAGDRQLEVATALRQILDLAGDATAGNSSSGGSGESRAACIAYVDAVQRLLEANVAYVAELLPKTSAASERLARLRKQGAQLAALGMTDKVAENRKQQDAQAARIQDFRTAAEGVQGDAKAAEQGLHRYGTLLSQLPPTVGNAVGAVQQLVVRLESLCDAIADAAAPPEAPRRRTQAEVDALLAGDAVSQAVASPAAGEGSAPTPPAMAAEPAGTDNTDVPHLVARLAALEEELAAVKSNGAAAAIDASSGAPDTNDSTTSNGNIEDQSSGVSDGGAALSAAVKADAKTASAAVDSAATGIVQKSRSDAAASAAAATSALNGIRAWGKQRPAPSGAVKMR